MRVSLVAAYASTAADVAADDERRQGKGHRSPWRDRPADEFEAVCWFDADAFGVSPSLLDETGGQGRVVDRLQEVIGPDGALVVHQFGRKDTLAVEPIPARGAGQ